jgi:cytochrome P450 family 628
MQLWSVDVMSDLVFGRSFNALRTQKSHIIFDLIRGNQKVVGAVGVVPWLLYLLTKMPKSLNPQGKFVRFSEQVFEERRKMKPEEPDVMSHLLAADQFFDKPTEERHLLIGDSRVLIVAGSDTTAAALTYVMYHVARDESVAQKLRAELANNNLNDDSVRNPTVLQSLPYLNAVINESLRLHPPLPGGVFRDTPPDGIKVGSHVIPGNITIRTPVYSIQRCKSSNTCSSTLG